MAPHIAFLGAGNMAGAIISGLLADGFAPEQLSASDPSDAALANLRALGLTQLYASPEPLCENADLVVLAVKPQVAPAALTALAPYLKPDTALLSIAAGISTTSLQKYAGNAVPIIRCMPNTPAMIGKGASALFASERASEGARQLAERITNAVGITVWVREERQLDAVTAVSGSGPAYFFAMIEAIAKAGTDLGLDADVAMALTLQTAWGAASLAQQADVDVSTLRVNVTSPGGTTEQALLSLAEGGFDAVIAEAVERCAARSRTLGEEFG